MEGIIQKAAIGAAGIVCAQYLDAKLDIRHDFNVIKAAIMQSVRAKKMLAKDRCNFFYMLEEAATAAPNRVSLVYQGQEWTYMELKLLAQRHLLLDIAANNKDHVAMDFTNKPEFMFVWLGLLSIGAVPALINFNLTSNSLLHCITAADAKLFIFDNEIAANVEGIKDSLIGIRSICLTDDSTPAEFASTFWTECVSSHFISTQSAERPPDSMRIGVKLIDIEMLMFTSGTTGLPKPAIISFNKLSSAPLIFADWSGLTHSDRFYTCMPLYHGTALLLGAAMMVLAQGTFVLGHKFKTQAFWHEVRNSKATCIQYVGEMCRYLLSAPPSEDDHNHCVRMAFGNGMRPDVWNRFRQRFGIDTIAEFYAATEGNAAQLNCSSGEYGSGCIGRSGALLQAFTRKIAVVVKMDPITEELERGPDGLCVKAGSGEAGELLFLVEPEGEKDAGRAFQGYYGNPSATKKKLTRDVLKKGDYFFRTGDIIRCQYDGLRRFTTFEDRIGDTFRWKGENVSTMEVAAVVGAYPGVDDANVYGVRLPNHDGRVGCAAISFHKGTSPDFRGLAQHLKAVLPRFAVPIFLRVTDAMILTGNMKHQKYEMREEGVDPEKCRGEKIMWLKNGDYIEFTKEHWEQLKGGKVKL